MVLWKVGLHDHPLLWLTLLPSATSPLASCHLARLLLALLIFCLFGRPGREHEALELRRNVTLSLLVITVQKAARKLLAKHLLRVHAAKLLCDAATFSRDIDELRAAAAAVRALPTSYQWGVATVALLQRVEVEVHILKTVERLLPQDAEVVFSELSSALHDADDLGDEFGALHASTLQQARDKVAMVGMRKQARSDLKQIIDGEALRHGLQLATKSQMWDPPGDPTGGERRREAISIAIVAPPASRRRSLAARATQAHLTRSPAAHHPRR